MNRVKEDPKQMNFLDFIKEQEAMRRTDEPGSLNMSAAVREAINDAISGCSKKRYQIAAEMSELLDLEITKTMLDAWTASSKDGYRFPLEYAAAFCKVTGCNRILEIVCRPVGIYALDGPDALRSQLQRMQDERKKISAQEKELTKMISLYERSNT
jgi:hypothetical protein